jgi:hypothetical protein
MDQVKVIKKRKSGILFILISYCLFSFTIGQFIPVYFINSNARVYYYLSLFTLLIITVIIKVFTIVHKPHDYGVIVSAFISLLMGFIIFTVFGIWTIGLLLGVWTEGSTYYIKKSNSKVKIISSYIDEGAFGGGTEPSDYHVVLHRPFLFFFKIETAVDTTCIDKKEWIKPKY